MTSRTPGRTAAELTLSPATVSRMESGDRLVRLGEIDVWVRVTGASATVGDELASLAEAAANQITPWRSRLHAGVDQTQRETAELEASAATILQYDHAVVPGLLQVREFARLVFAMADDADTLVTVELVTDEVTISEPTSVARYLREFDRLRAGAAYDEAAHALIDHIIADLRAEGT